MKVLQINITANSGSTGRIAEEIGLYIQKRGWESYIAYSRGKAQSKSHLIHIGNLFDIYIHGIQTRLFDNHGQCSLTATNKLIKQIKSLAPDIIHLHNIHGYYLNYPVLFEYLSESKIPVIWTLHDCWSYTGHCAYYSYENCNKWQTECNNCPQLCSYPKSIWKDRSKKNYIDKKINFNSLTNVIIVPVSNWLAKEVNKSFLKNYPIHTIHNGIDIDTFTVKNNNRVNSSNKSFTILGVANIWEKRKGLADFIHLRSLLPSSYCIILIGLTQKQIKKLPAGIIGIERTNNIDELVDYYNLADVYINFSVEETFGMTTCESMACGTPVIVYNSTACPEIVTEETGFIVEVGDFNTVIKNIKIIEEKGKEKYQNSCRERIVKYYNKEDKYKEYFKLYNKLLNSKHENIINNNNL